ncbi:MAG: class I SAM-dependent methyltransferase [Paracoccaceae bacterium]
MPRSVGFWNFIAKRYTASPIDNEAAYRHKIDETQSRLRPDMRLLEFGCGSGSTALIHAPHVAHIQAIDYSHKMIAIARHNAGEQGIDNVSFEVSSIEDWPAEDGSYDAILGLSILHLLVDRNAVAAKVHRLLKPGGLFFSSTVLVAETGGVAKYILPVGSALRLLPYVAVINASDLLQTLSGAGFEIEFQWQPQKQAVIFIVAKAV